MVQDNCHKNLFDPFLIQNDPFSRHFGIYHVPKGVTVVSSRVQNTFSSMLNGPRSLVANLFLTNFWSSKWPLFKACWDFACINTHRHGPH